MKKIEAYIREQVQDINILIKLKVLFDSADGFYTEMSRFDYTIHVPMDKHKLTWPVKLTLKHEVGHVLFFEWIDTMALKVIMADIDRHRLFCFFQKIWYWNPIVRWFKKLFGFSTTIKYKRNDIYMFGYTREDNELFCDWNALKGVK